MPFHESRLSHCLLVKNNNAKPTPNTKYTPVLYLTVKVHVCAYIYTQKMYQYWHKKDNSISRRTSIVAKFWD